MVMENNNIVLKSVQVWWWINRDVLKESLKRIMTKDVSSDVIAKKITYIEEVVIYSIVAQ